MNEGERKKKIYVKGDVVSFRLLKKQHISNDTLKLLNSDGMNLEILKALNFYCKYRDREKEFLRFEEEFKNFLNSSSNEESKKIIISEVVASKEQARDKEIVDDRNQVINENVKTKEKEETPYKKKKITASAVMRGIRR